MQQRNLATMGPWGTVRELAIGVGKELLTHAATEAARLPPIYFGHMAPSRAYDPSPAAPAVFQPFTDCPWCEIAKGLAAVELFLRRGIDAPAYTGWYVRKAQSEIGALAARMAVSPGPHQAFHSAVGELQFHLGTLVGPSFDLAGLAGLADRCHAVGQESLATPERASATAQAANANATGGNGGVAYRANAPG